MVWFGSDSKIMYQNTNKYQAVRGHLVWCTLCMFTSVMFRHGGSVVRACDWQSSGRVFESCWGRLETLAISFTPLCQCLSEETKTRWSLLSGVYARGSKISHTGGDCVTCRGLHNSTWSIMSTRRWSKIKERKWKWKWKGVIVLLFLLQVPYVIFMHFIFQTECMSCIQSSNFWDRCIYYINIWWSIYGWMAMWLSVPVSVVNCYLPPSPSVKLRRP